MAAVKSPAEKALFPTAFSSSADWREQLKPRLRIENGETKAAREQGNQLGTHHSDSRRDLSSSAGESGITAP